MEKEVEEKIEEGMFPELGGKKIRIGKGIDKIELHIIESPIFYTKQLNKELQPIYSMFTGTDKKVDVESLVNVNKIDGFLDTLVNAAFIVTSRINPELTKQRLEEIASEKDLLAVIGTQLEVNGIVNFFKNILAGVINMAAKMGGIQKEPNI